MAAAAAAPSVTTMMAVSGVGGGSSGGARPAGRPAEAGSRPPRNVPEQMSVWTRSPETRAKTVYCLPTKNSNPQLASDRSVETQNVRVATPLYTASTAKRTLIGSALEITKPVMGGSTTVTVPRNTTSARAPCCAAVCCTQEQASTREPRPSESAPATTANVSKRTTLVTIAPGTIGNVRKKNRDRAEWERTTYADATKRIPERAKFETTYGAPLPPLFDGDAADPGLPGEPPYTRGIQPTMYRGRLWTMRQYAGFGTAAESNARYRYLLGQGQTGLSVAFALPTQMGYDADDPRVAGEVGKVGVSISSLEDFARLFAGIPMGDVTTSMTINATAAILLAMYAAIAKRQGVAADRVAGTTQNDILKEYIARGTYIFPPRPSMRLATDLIAYCSERHRSRSGSTRRPWARPSPRSSRRTTSSAPRSRRSPRFSEEPSRFTPTRTTRRSGFRPKSPCASRFGRSRSSRRNQALPKPSTRSEEPTPSRRSPPTSSAARSPRSRRSTAWAARSP